LIIILSSAFIPSNSDTEGDVSVEMQSIEEEIYDFGANYVPGDPNTRVITMENKRIIVTSEVEETLERRLSTQSSTFGPPEITTQATSPILLVDSDGGNGFEIHYENTLTSMGISKGSGYDIHDIEIDGRPDLALFEQYQLVIWFTSNRLINTINATDATNLASYLDGGGKLWVTGQDIGYDINICTDPLNELCAPRTAEETAILQNFYLNYMHAQLDADGGIETILSGETGGIFDGIQYTMGGGDGSGVNTYPSDIRPVGTANLEMTYNKKPNQGAAVSFTNATFSILYMAFAWDAIDTLAMRTDSMQRIFTWMNLDFSGSDTAPPKIISQTPDLSIPYNVDGYTISWNFTDQNPDIVDIYRNGTWIGVQPYSNDTLTTISVDNLDPGTWEFTAEAFDDGRFSTISTIFVYVVIDTSFPVFTQIQANKTTELGSPPIDFMVWNATDQLPDGYILLVNGVVTVIDTWDNSSLMGLNVESFDIGLYNFTIAVFDLPGNVILSTAWLTVQDTTSPVGVSSPGNQTIVEDSTGNQIAWVATDLRPSTFEIFVNGVVDTSGSWSSGVPISISIDGQGFGLHNYTIIARDSSGNTVTDTIFVEVVEYTAPILTQIATNETFSQDDPNSVFSYTAIDNNPSTFFVFANGTLVGQAPWLSGVPVQLNVSGVIPALYNITSLFVDLAGNFVTHTVWITIQDVTPPTINIGPIDFQYLEGATGNWLNWTVEDRYNDSYLLYRNGSLVSSGSWDNFTAISYAVDGLSFGLYNFTIIIYDTHGNSITDQVWVTVTEIDAPTFDLMSPGTAYSEGTGPHVLTWNGNDAYPSTYLILKNGSEIAAASWNNVDNISINVDGLGPGTFNYTIVLYDLAGNYAVHSALVTVTDDTNPVLIFSPTDTTIESGTTGNNLLYQALDLHPTTYQLLRNGSIFASGIWLNSNNLTFNIDTLALGTHNFTIIISDESGNTFTHTALITFGDTVAPVLSNPSNIQYEEDVTNNKITWSVTELNPDGYTVYRNGSEVAGGGYTSGGPITIYVDDLSVGVYNYTILVADKGGNLDTHTVYVTVVDTLAPTLSLPAQDVSYSFGVTGNAIELVGSDNNPQNYIVYRNGSQIDSGPWVDEGTIRIPVDNLGLGVYNYTVVLFDASGNSIVDEALVFVSDASVFTFSPPDLSITNDTVGNELRWTVEDSNPSHYRIYKNGSIVQSGTWESGVDVTIDVSETVINTYNYTIWVNDTDGNVVIDTAHVYVTDNPLVSTPVDIGYNEQSTGNSITWNATDTIPGTYEIFKDGISIQTGSWTNLQNITISIDGLLEGVYVYTIVFTDGSSNSINDTVNVTVTDVTSPSVSDTGDISNYEQTSTGNIISWIVGDFHPNLYNVTKDGSEYIGNTSWSNGTLEIDIDGLTVGSHTFVITVTDNAGNLAQDTVIVSVIDTTIPEISNPDDITNYQQTTLGNIITWTVGDPNIATYNVTLDGAEYIANTAQGSNTTLNVDIDGLSLGSHTFVIYVIDSEGNVNFNSVSVTVIDTTNPVLSDTVDISNYEQTSTGNTLSWTVGDPNNNSFTVTKDGAFFTSGLWSNGTIVVPIDSLTLGSYTFVITVNDTQGNQIQDTVIVTVIDTNAPSVSDTANISDYEQATLGNIISWTLGDPNPSFYNVTLDGEQYLGATSWVNSTVEINIDGLSLGSYTFVIYVNDTLGNIAQDTVLVTVVDTTAPELTPLGDINDYELGSSGNTISWTVGDPNPSFYNISLDGALNTSDTLWNNGTINLEIDGLALGSYVFVLFLNDTQGNWVIDSVTVTVIDTTGPSLTTPADLSYVEGAGGNSISWTATELLPSLYTIYRDGVIVNSSTWTSGVAILESVNGLSVGNYNFTIMINDTSGNISTDTVYVEVRDASPPTVIGSTDFSYSEGSSGNQINWTISDSNSDNYEVYLDEISYLNGTWSDNVPELISVDGLSKGVFNFTIVAFDASGNFVVDEVIVTVTDDKAPSLITTNGDSFEQGSTGNFVNFTATDNHVSMYEIRANGTLIFSGSWTSGVQVNISLDALTLGSWDIQIFVNDTSANTNTTVIVFTVIDTLRPTTVDQSSDFTYEAGSTGNEIAFNLTDFNPSSYLILQNGSQVDTGTWDSGVEFSYNVDNLLIGIYNFTAVVIDSSGNDRVLEVIVTVEDTSNPSVTSAGDTSYEETSTGNTLIWNISDLYNTTYSVLLNGTPYGSGNWNSDIDLEINIDGLVLGIYNFTIIASDSSGNTIADQSIVQVLDTQLVIIVTSGDINYNEGASGNTIHWNGTDINPDQYELFLNGSLAESGTWTVGTKIEANVDGLPKGNYNYTIILSDTSGNNATSTVIVTVIDAISPNITQTPGISTVIENSEGNTIAWEVTDSYPGVYEIYSNGSLVGTNTWASAKNITISIDGLSIGLYNYTILVFDESGNFNTTTHFFTVIDTTAPSFIDIPRNLEFSEGSSVNIVTWTAQDLHSGTYEYIIDGSLYLSGSWISGLPFAVNLDFLDWGEYNWTVVVFDSSGNSNVASIVVTVLDTTSPTFVASPTNSTYNEETTGNLYSLTVTENYPSQYDIYINGSLQTPGSFVNNVPFNIDLDGLNKGTYNITVKVTDQSGNMDQTSFYLVVTDNNLPIITGAPEDAEFNENEITHILLWNVTDSHPETYEIYKNNVLEVSGIWTTSVLFNISDLERGSYNFTLIVYDESGNSVSDMVEVVIYDITAPVFINQPNDFTAHADDIGVSVSWIVTDLHPSVYTIVGISELPISGQWVSGEIISVDLDEVDPGNYTVNITVEDDSGNVVIDTVIIKILEEGIIETTQPQFGNTPFVHEGDQELIFAQWTTIQGDPIENGEISIQLYDLGKLISETTTYTNATGYYSINLNYTGLIPGNYDWIITFEAEGYESRLVSLRAIVIPHTYRVELQAPPELVQGEQYWITATVYYNNTRNQTGLGMDQIGQNLLIPVEGEANGVEVTFQITITKIDETTQTISKSTSSDGNGVAAITFTGTETLNMQSIESISASGVSDYGVATAAELPEFSLPQIIEGNPGFLVRLIVYVEQYRNEAFGFILGMVLLFGLIGFVVRRLKERFKFMLDELTTSHQELSALRSIKAIILQSTTGVPVYVKEISDFDVEATLISGLTTAISAFMGEVGGDELFGFETMERQGLSITSHNGEYSKLIIISDDQLPMIFLKKVKDAHEAIEAKHARTLSSLIQGGRQFESDEIDPIFEQQEIFLNIRENLEFNRRNLRRVQRIRSISRNLKDNISSLLYLYDELDTPSTDLHMIMQYFEDRNTNPETASRAILLAYRYEVLSKTEEER
jgi:hypothetical protein